MLKERQDFYSTNPITYTAEEDCWVAVRLVGSQLSSAAVKLNDVIIFAIDGTITGLSNSNLPKPTIWIYNTLFVKKGSTLTLKGSGLETEPSFYTVYGCL